MLIIIQQIPVIAGANDVSIGNSSVNGLLSRILELLKWLVLSNRNDDFFKLMPYNSIASP